MDEEDIDIDMDPQEQLVERIGDLVVKTYNTPMRLLQKIITNYYAELFGDPWDMIFIQHVATVTTSEMWNQEESTRLFMTENMEIDEFWDQLFRAWNRIRRHIFFVYPYSMMNGGFNLLWHIADAPVNENITANNTQKTLRVNDLTGVFGRLGTYSQDINQQFVQEQINMMSFTGIITETAINQYAIIDNGYIPYLQTHLNIRPLDIEDIRHIFVQVIHNTIGRVIGPLPHDIHPYIINMERPTNYIRQMLRILRA